MTLSNPVGYWALAAIPLVVLIHFLQERSRRVRVSTLFLLEHAQPLSVGGARVERFRNAVPLWLQLLAVLVVTWLLVEPRWTREESRQVVAVVLDSSASMEAFRERWEPELAAALAGWERAAAVTEWMVMETDLRKPQRYRGTEMAGVREALGDWRPRRGMHDVAEALALARSLVKAEGAVLLVTDRAVTVGEGVGVIAVGQALENVGWVGWETVPAAEEGREATWTVLVKNHAAAPQERRWWVEYPGLNGEPEGKAMRLKAGEVRTLRGGFPVGEDRLWLRLGGDGFALDDALPLQRPVPKVLRVENRLGGETGELFQRMLEALEHVEVVAGEGALGVDLVVSALGEGVDSHAIQVVVGDGGGGVRLDPAPVLADAHPLTRDLDWSGLLTPAARGLRLAEGDESLLWKGTAPLAVLRPGWTGGERRVLRLLMGWDPAVSSAERNPAVLVLVHRFVERLRAEKRVFEAGTFESGQVLSGGVGVMGRVLKVDGEERVFEGRVPEEPGFFEVWEGGERLVAGAAAFGDPREGDFSEATTMDTSGALQREVAMRQTEADPMTPLWLMVLVGLMLGSWGWGGKRLVVVSRGNGDL